MRPLTRQLTRAIGLLLISSAACSGTIALPSPTPIIAATKTAPTLTEPISSATLALASLPSAESGKSPDYKITAQTPAFNGSPDPRVSRLNHELADIVAQEIATFKQSLADLTPSPISAGSSLDVSFKLVSPPGNIISMKIEVEGYSDGAAHPYHLTRTVNYDLNNGADITLAQLFMPGADYLQAVADYCKAELAKRDIAFDSFAAGADPTPENYRNWNITAGGLAITFDEYQVAPYAAGPQIVTIPSAALQDILAPAGPLGP